MRLFLSGIILAVAVNSPVSTAGKVYTWIDADGIKHFSDKPPQGAERRFVQGDIQAGELKVDKFNTMQPYVPPTAGSNKNEENSNAVSGEVVESSVTVQSGGLSQ